VERERDNGTCGCDDRESKDEAMNCGGRTRVGGAWWNGETGDGRRSVSSQLPDEAYRLQHSIRLNR